MFPSIGSNWAKFGVAGIVAIGSFLLLIVFGILLLFDDSDYACGSTGNVSQNVKPISQFARDQYNSEYQVQLRGDETCGEASMVMIFNAYAGSQKYTIADILKMGKPYGLFVPGGGTVTEAVPSVAKLAGLQAEIHPFDVGKIVAAANTGNPVMVLIASPYTAGNGHFIVVTGGDDHNVQIDDPGANSSALKQTRSRQWLQDHNADFARYITFKPDDASGMGGNACGQPTPTAVVSDSAKLTNSEARAMLSNAGISVTSSGNCSNRNSFSCTSLDQVRSKTIAGIIAFQKSSSCKITITGGTEYGHAGGDYSHSNGYKLDIAPTACVTNYIHSHFKYKGLRSGDNAPMYDDASGNRYANEGSHWDIVYY